MADLTDVIIDGDPYDEDENGGWFAGATANTDGEQGDVPQPLAGQQNATLFGDGTWKTLLYDALSRYEDAVTGRSYTYSGDLNDITQNCIVNTNGSNTNLPSGITDWGFVITLVHSNAATYATQIYITMNEADARRNMWFRDKDNGTWRSWKRLLTENDLTSINSSITSLNSGVSSLNSSVSSLNTNVNSKIPLKTDGGLGSISGGGKYSYCKLATLEIKSSYINRPIVFEISGRGRSFNTVQIIFASANTTDVGITSFTTDYDTCFWLYKVSAGKYELHAQYNEMWGSMTIHRITGAGCTDSSVLTTVTLANESSIPSGATQVTKPFKSQADINAAVSAAKVGNAAVGDVLSGKTFTNASTSGLTGTMTNRGAWGSTINPSGSVTIPAGYHNGSGKVTANPNQNSGIYDVTGHGTKLDMGANNTYRYVNTQKAYDAGYAAGRAQGRADTQGGVCIQVRVQNGKGATVTAGWRWDSEDWHTIRDGQSWNITGTNTYVAKSYKVRYNSPPMIPE